MAFELKIIARDATELGEKIAELAAQYGVTAQAGNEEAPKTRKPRKASTDSAPADGTASEQSSPNASTLVADEGNVEAAGTPNVPADLAAPTSNIPDAPSNLPTRDEVLTAATKFSQTQGADALAEVLAAMGAKRFSEIAEGDWPKFVEWMDAYKPNALS